MLLVVDEFGNLLFGAVVESVELRPFCVSACRRLIHSSSLSAIVCASVLIVMVEMNASEWKLDYVLSVADGVNNVDEWASVTNTPVFRS